jgi:hypothetical protein
LNFKFEDIQGWKFEIYLFNLIDEPMHSGRKQETYTETTWEYTWFFKEDNTISNDTSCTDHEHSKALMQPQDPQGVSWRRSWDIGHWTMDNGNDKELDNDQFVRGLKQRNREYGHETFYASGRTTTGMLAVHYVPTDYHMCMVTEMIDSYNERKLSIGPDLWERLKKTVWKCHE